MKATQVIKELEELVAQYGDQDVVVYNGDPVDPAEIEAEGVIVSNTDGKVTFEIA